MMLWQEKAGARYMYYVPSLAWLPELSLPPPSRNTNRRLQPRPSPSLTLSLTLTLIRCA